MGRIGPGYLEAARGLGFLRRAAQLGWDWDSSKRAPRNTRKEEQIRPFQSPNDAERNQKAWRVIIHEQGAGTSGNLERSIKESSWENLQPGRNGFGSPGKNDKNKYSQKAESKKVRFRSLEGREIGGQLFKDTLEWKVSKRLLGKQHQKKKTMRNKERTSH